MQFRRAGQQGPTRTLTERCICGIHSQSVAYSVQARQCVTSQCVCNVIVNDEKEHSAIVIE